MSPKREAKYEPEVGKLNVSVYRISLRLISIERHFHIRQEPGLSSQEEGFLGEDHHTSHFQEPVTRNQAHLS